MTRTAGPHRAAMILVGIVCAGLLSGSPAGPAGGHPIAAADAGDALCRTDPATVAPPLLIRALARSAEEVARMPPAVLVEIRDNRGDTRQILARYDPRQAWRGTTQQEPKRAQRSIEAGEGPWVGGWRVLERNEKPVSTRAAQRRAGKLAHDGPPGSYGLIARYLQGEITAVYPLGKAAIRSSDESTAGAPPAVADVHWRIAIARLGPGSLILKGEDLSALISGELDVACDALGPHVVRARLRLRAPASLSWLVKIRDGEADERFGRDAQGRPILLEERLAIDVKPILFPSFHYETTRRYRDHRFPASAAIDAQTGRP